jgi:hypothetical protein
MRIEYAAIARADGPAASGPDRAARASRLKK